MRAMFTSTRSASLRRAVAPGLALGGCRSPRCSSSPMRRCRSRSSDASCSASAEQLKWLLSGAAVAILGAIATVTLSHASSPVLSALGAAGYLTVMALPVGIGIGVLRYRLYEIDRLISRTLTYAILTGLLAGTFIGLVTLATDTLALSGRVGVAASTLAAAALFNPLRVRVQRFVDRRFNRARYNAAGTVAPFSARP